MTKAIKKMYISKTSLIVMENTKIHRKTVFQFLMPIVNQKHVDQKLQS